MSEEKRDYVAETVKTFITGSDMEPTDPLKAIEAYFEKNASADLKARAKAEGKTAKTCWTFLEAVARKALHGHSGHIDPVVVYAIAMHYFDDIPADWNRVKTAAESGQTEANGYRSNDPKDVEAAERSKRLARERRAKMGIVDKPDAKPVAALPIEIGEPEPEEPKAKEKPKDKPKKHFKKQQGFFFDLIETPVVGPSGSEATAEGKEAPDAQ